MPPTQLTPRSPCSVVMWEVLTWERPWGATNPWQISSAVLSGRRLQVPDPAALPGPAADSPEAFAAYVQLMQQCWAQAPGDRPSYPEVVQALRWVRVAAAGVWGLFKACAASHCCKAAVLTRHPFLCCSQGNAGRGGTNGACKQLVAAASAVCGGAL